MPTGPTVAPLQYSNRIAAIYGLETGQYQMQTAGVAAAYDRWAPVYDLVFGKVFRIGRRQAVIAAEQAGSRILEVGVGTGISLPQYGAQSRLTGTDISEAMLDVARKRVGKHRLSNVEELVPSA